MVDFEAPLTLLVAALGSWAWVRLRQGWLAALWKVGFTVLVAVGSLFYLLAAVQQFEQYRNTRPASFAALSRALNVPYRWLYAAGMPAPGLLVMTVHFSPQKEPSIEPLVTTGTPGYSDSVYAAQFPNHLVQFSFNHKGYGGPMGPLMALDVDKDHEIEITMGSFYPPPGDSYFTQISDHSTRLLKRLAYLRMDGIVVMSATMAFYESPPWSRQIGANDTTLTEFKRSFSGRISEVYTMSVDPLINLLNRTEASGILRYKIVFPKRQPLSGLPLLGIGDPGDGNLLFAKSDGPGRYRAAMDDWGYRSYEGEAFSATPGEHDLEIVLGPILARSRIPASWKGDHDLSVLANRVVVSVDGRVLGSFQVIHHANRFDALTPGANPQGFSTAEAEFAGSFEAFPMMDTELRDLLDRAAQASGR
jgi:hypothetical protein